MTVETFVPGEQRISMTDAAIAQARKEIQREHVAGIRLSVKESGCSGYMYVLDYADQATSEDKVFEIADQVQIFINQESLPVLNGTEIDYVTEGVNSFFKFRNPNAVGECGCGESFTITEPGN